MFINSEKYCFCLFLIGIQICSSNTPTKRLKLHLYHYLQTDINFTLHF